MRPAKLPALGLLLAALAGAGCAAFNSGELRMEREVTIGQELLDLKEAHEIGAITTAEYAKLKHKVLEMVDSTEMIHEIDFDDFLDD